jgi:hypothetical protein
MDLEVSNLTLVQRFCAPCMMNMFKKLPQRKDQIQSTRYIAFQVDCTQLSADRKHQVCSECESRDWHGLLETSIQWKPRNSREGTVPFEQSGPKYWLMANRYTTQVAKLQRTGESEFSETPPEESRDRASKVLYSSRNVLLITSRWQPNFLKDVHRVTSLNFEVDSCSGIRDSAEKARFSWNELPLII